MNNKISFAAAGDYLVTRRIVDGDNSFNQISSIINDSDAAVTNLEITISDCEGTPNAYSGGFHLYTTPDRLEDLKKYGFNLVAMSNNHALDYSVDGMEKTMEYLKQYGITFAGIGMNEALAGKPAYIDTNGGRVALISVNSSMHKSWFPGEQRRDIKGRPGPNGLRILFDNRVTNEQLQAMKEINDETKINNMIEMMFDQGFNERPKAGLVFGFDIYGNPMLFRPVMEGEKVGSTSFPHPADMNRINKTIKQAKLSADYVVINLHAHEMKGSDIAIPSDFQLMAAKKWIDEGADAVVIEGCHQTRGVEIYKDRPIFYSLGNFIYQGDTVEVLPQDFYRDNNATNDESFMEIIDKSSRNPEWLTSSKVSMSGIFTKWGFKDGKLDYVHIYPVTLEPEKQRYQNGFPKLSDDSEILDRVIILSKAFGTKIEKQEITLCDGKIITIGVCKL